MTASDANHRCNLNKTHLSTQSISGVSGIRSPSRRRSSVRAVMLLAWVAFWLNSVLFPCCEAIAAAADDHSDDQSQSVSATEPLHDADQTHPEHSHDSPGSPCDQTLDTGPATIVEYASLPNKRVRLECSANYLSFAVGSSDLNHPAILALRDYHPPPPPPATVRLYLRTQRLLI